MQRRRFLTLSAAAAASAALPLAARATVPKPYSWDAGPPMDSAVSFIRWMVENRGEEPRYLRARFERFQNMVGHVDLWEARNKRAFLMTPRDEFCLPSDRGVIYDVNYHSIGFGVTITGPRVVGRMTSSIDVKMGEKVLEIGTGSGYQSAYLSNLTDKVWTIEIIKPLAERTRALHDALIARGYTEFKSINSKQADGSPRSSCLSSCRQRTVCSSINSSSARNAQPPRYTSRPPSSKTHALTRSYIRRVQYSGCVLRTRMR